MKNLILSTVIGLAAMATPALADRADVLDAAQALRQDLNQLSQRAENVAENAAENGNQVRAQRFARVSNQATNLAQDVRQYVIRPLQQGASQNQLRQSVQYLNERQLENAIQQINQVPDNVQQAIRNARVGLRQLRNQIHGNWGGGGGGGGQWQASCRVVLETLWGTDLQDFYGRGRAQTRQAALNEAREDGRNQCAYSPRFGGLTRCTVDTNNCDAQRRIN